MDRTDVASCCAKNASSVLHTTMEVLHSEVNEAEQKIQAGFSAMWKEAFAMLEQQSDASEIYISTKDKEIYVLQAKIDEFERVKISTEEENSKLRSELNDAFQKFSVVSQELQLTKRKYEDSQEEFKNERSRLDREHASEVSKYKYTIQELSVSVKEYQSKITSMTTKMNQLSEKILLEKTSSDKTKKAFSSQLSNQTAEAKKAALEMTKMKTDMANCNKALAAAKQNIKKLQLVLHETRQNSESTILELQKQHSALIKTLNEEIYSLQHQLEELKRLHRDEIERMKEKNKEPDRDDFLEARISFLHHQERKSEDPRKYPLKLTRTLQYFLIDSLFLFSNRREKVKIQEKIR